MIEGAIENGIYNFGENYAQELQEKASIIRKQNLIWLLYRSNTIK